MGMASFNRMRRIEAQNKEVSLKDSTVTELKAKAKELGLTGYSKLNMNELIELIESEGK